MFHEEYPNDIWYSLIGLRNRLFHSYEDINLEMVFYIVEKELEGLIALLSSLID